MEENAWQRKATLGRSRRHLDNERLLSSAPVNHIQIADQEQTRGVKDCDRNRIEQSSLLVGKE